MSCVAKYIDSTLLFLIITFSFPFPLFFSFLLVLPSLGLFLSSVHYHFSLSFFFFLTIFDLSKCWFLFNIDIQIFDMKIYPISFCITWIIYLPLCHYSEIMRGRSDETALPATCSANVYSHTFCIVPRVEITSFVIHPTWLSSYTH